MPPPSLCRLFVWTTTLIVLPIVATAEPGMSTTVQTSKAVSDTHRDSYVAIESRDRLPFGNLQTSTRVAVSMFNADGNRTVGDDLWSFAIEGNQGQLKYGARVYSVGESFDDSEIGRARLNGLIPSSDGKEFWAALPAGKFRLQTQLRNDTRHHASGNEQRRFSSISVHRPMPAGARMSLTFNVQELAPDHGRFIKQSRRSNVLIARESSRLQLSYLDEATESQDWQRRKTRHEIRGQFSSLSAVRLIPRLSRTTRFDGQARRAVSQHAGVVFDFSQPSSAKPNVRLGIGIDEQRFAESDLTAQMLDVSLKTNWQRQLTATDRVLMGARLSYQESLGSSAVDSGLGIHFTVELTGG